ncbi:MAG: hypothetical protein DRP73_03355 [Candidatus Omnitrophota bacterium]|nr:MAG: hypothetical protein DRP73_03355 [Candidatus Omnitrophota bacterium]
MGWTSAAIVSTGGVAGCVYVAYTLRWPYAPVVSMPFDIGMILLPIISSIRWDDLKDISRMDYYIKDGVIYLRKGLPPVEMKVVLKSAISEWWSPDF